MKKTILGGAIALASVLSVHSQIISQWTFEVNTPADLTDTATILGIAADVGAGTASGVHVSSLTDWSTPVGNSSVNSLSSNNWAVGDYFQFQVSTTGFSDIHLIWNQTSSNTGPRDFALQYSTDGSTFTQFGNAYQVPANANSNAWATNTYISIAEFSFDLSSLTAINGQSAVIFDWSITPRFSANGGTVATAGTDRVDNFTVSQGTVSIAPVPEPGTVALIAMGLGSWSGECAVAG